SDPVLSECPSCGKAGLKKLLSAAGFQLKGSGWYATDSKGGAGSKKSDGDAGGSSESGSQTHGCGGGSCGGCAH
ncbi:MAG: zinc ribbon domain-containing protein, partial [Pseudomonadota bacterium]